ncbi:MAG: large subunit ribosomal protein L32 [Candidatus Latescibacterota bacterium]|jgi:large subunit ribosomal protein L32
MAAVPKRKISRSVRGMRRSHWKIKASARSTCSSCSQPTLPHRVCKSCGTYRGREYTEPEV